MLSLLRWSVHCWSFASRRCTPHMRSMEHFGYILQYVAFSTTSSFQALRHNFWVSGMANMSRVGFSCRNYCGLRLNSCFIGHWRNGELLCWPDDIRTRTWMSLLLLEALTLLCAFSAIKLQVVWFAQRCMVIFTSFLAFSSAPVCGSDRQVHAADNMQEIFSYVPLRLLKKIQYHHNMCQNRSMPWSWFSCHPPHK